MAALTVFGLPAQAETARVLTCLFEKDLSFGLVRRDSYNVTAAHGGAPESFKEPTGQVMVMEGETGKVVSPKSRDICRHICTSYPRSGNSLLLGAGDLERASIEDWNRREAQLFDPPSTALIMQLASLTSGRGFLASVNENERRLAEVLDGYEDRLAERQYLAGDDFSLADLFHLPNAACLYRTALGYELINERANVCRWWETISSRDSWKMVQEMQKQHSGDPELPAVPVRPTSTRNALNFLERRTDMGQHRADEIRRDEQSMHDMYVGDQRKEQLAIDEFDPYSELARAERVDRKKKMQPSKPPADKDNDRAKQRTERRPSMEPYKKTKGGDGKPKK